MLSRGFVVLWFAMLVAMMGISMVSPLLPVYVREDLGGPQVGVALSFSGMAIAQIVTAPFAGRLGDRFGPKRFIVIGFLIYCVGAVGYLFATTWEVVVFFRVLSGAGAAGIFPMSMAYIGRLAPEGAEGRFMGWFSVAQIAGFGIGPLFGGGIRDAAGSDAAFAAMALLLGGTALATFVLLPPRPARPGGEEEIVEVSLSWGQLVRRPTVQAATLFVLLSSLGWGAAASFMAIYVVSEEGLNTGSALFVGVLLSSRSLINAVLQPPMGMVADRYNRIMLVMVGLVLAGVGQFFIPSVPGTIVETSVFGVELTLVPWLLAIVVVVGVAESIAFPAEQAVFVTIGRSVGMGSLMGLNSMGGSVGFLSGSLVGALVVEQYGIEAVFRWAGIVTILGALVFWALMRRAGEEMAAAEAIGAREEAVAVAG
jgi:MFS family permease